jgi:hypothetical protein
MFWRIVRLLAFGRDATARRLLLAFDVESSIRSGRLSVQTPGRGMDFDAVRTNALHPTQNAEQGKPSDESTRPTSKGISPGGQCIAGLGFFRVCNLAGGGPAKVVRCLRKICRMISAAGGLNSDLCGHHG